MSAQGKCSRELDSSMCVWTVLELHAAHTPEGLRSLVLQVCVCLRIWYRASCYMYHLHSKLEALQGSLLSTYIQARSVLVR